MRTKTLLLTAALTAAGASGAMAQTVYSVNAVGYVNLTLPANGPLATIANPLNGTNNFLSTVLPLPDSADGTTVYFYNTANVNYDSAVFFGGFGWNPDLEAKPGQGFFIAAKNDAIGSTTLPVTFVGEVPQGTLINDVPPANKLGLKSSIVPQAAQIGDEATAGTLGFPAEDGDTLFQWNEGIQMYDNYTYFGGFGWNPGDIGGPVIEVARSFFIQKGSAATKLTWTRVFSVN